MMWKLHMQIKVNCCTASTRWCLRLIHLRIKIIQLYQALQNMYNKTPNSYFQPTLISRIKRRASMWQKIIVNLPADGRRRSIWDSSKPSKFTVESGRRSSNTSKHDRAHRHEVTRKNSLSNCRRRVSQWRASSRSWTRTRIWRRWLRMTQTTPKKSALAPLQPSNITRKRSIRCDVNLTSSLVGVTTNYLIRLTKLCLKSLSGSSVRIISPTKLIVSRRRKKQLQVW